MSAPFEIASPPRSTDAWIAVQFTLAGVVWGASFLFIALALEGLSPAQVATGRTLFGAVTLGLIALVTRDRLPRSPRVWAHLALLSVTFAVIPYMLFAWAQQYVASGVASIVNATTPIMTALIAGLAFRIEKLTREQVLGIVVGIIGVVVIVGPWQGIEPGPGGIAPNLDFGNQVIPCIGAGAVWKCKPTVGGRYLELMVTNNGTMPVSSISATALTPGVTLALFNTVPYPVAVGASVVMNFDVTGLAPGAAAQIVISMSGPPDMSGKSEECCRDTLTVVRPGGPGVILKWCGPVWTDFHLVDFVRDPRRPRMDRWTVRMRDALGRSTTAVTDTSGYALIEGMPLGTYTYSVDMQHGWRMLEPSTGFYQRTFREGDRGINGLRFVLSDVTVSGLDGSLPIPSEYALRENIPNPFTSTTNIRYALPQSGHVRLDVFDMLGRHVATLVDGVQAAGQYEEPFEARELASGVYLYVLKAGPFVASRRMLVIN